MIPPYKSFFLCIFAAMSFHAGLLQAASLLDASISYGYNDNLSNGELARDVKGDQYLDISLGGGQYFQLNRDLSLLLTANAAATAYDTYSGLNYSTLGVAGTLRKKFGLGPMATMLQARLDISHLNSNHDLRDRWIYKGGIGIRKRLHSRFELRMDWERLETDPDHRDPGIAFLLNRGIGPDVWKLSRRSLTTAMVLTLSENLSAYGRYSRQEGSIVSSTIPDIDRLSVYQQGVFDPVFGTGVVAYTIDADSDIGSLGLSWVLNQNCSLNLSYERRESEGGAGFRYDNNLTQASLQVAF